jgi:hypothetical protein
MEAQVRINTPKEALDQIVEILLPYAVTVQQELLQGVIEHVVQVAERELEVLQDHIDQSYAVKQKIISFAGQLHHGAEAAHKMLATVDSRPREESRAMLATTAARNY